MTASKVQLTGGNFQDSEGNVLNLGYLKMMLSQDGTVPGVGNICSGIEITIQLTSSGSVSTSPAQYVWGNDAMSPANSYYKVTGYTAAGQPCWGPNIQQVTGTGPFDVGTWVPGQVLSWTPPPSTTVLKSNGVLNSNQSVLNLESSNASVVITDLGSGTVNLTTTPPTPPTVVELQHNGVDNTSQILLDFVDTASVTWANTGGQMRATAIPAAPTIPIGSSILPMPSCMPGFSPISTAFVGDGTTTHAIAGRQIINQAATWKVSVNCVSASIPIAKMVMLKCTRDTGTVISSTSITFGGNASFTWLAGDNQSDAITLLMDREHDYYLMWYSTAGGGNISFYQTTQGSTFAGGWVSAVTGDHTTDNPVTLTGALNGSLAHLGSCLISDFQSA